MEGPSWSYIVLEGPSWNYIVLEGPSWSYIVIFIWKGLAGAIVTGHTYMTCTLSSS